MIFFYPRTIWVFKNELTGKGLFEVLFDKFDQYLKDNNLIMNEGIIIDGSFVEVPRQRNSREENKLRLGHGWNMCSGIWRGACTGCVVGRLDFSEIQPKSSSHVWFTTC